MAIESESNGMVMPVAPMYGGYGSGSGFGSAFGNDGWWIILLFILLGNNGWGNGFGGGFGNVGGEIYPWMNQSNQISNGFRDQLLNDNITSIRDGVTGLATQLCNGFSQAEIAANNRQMADMQQNFALQSSLQQCCCDNRAATADLKYTVATENCADRAALSDGVRDIIASQTASTQRILDQLCQDKIDAKNDTIAQLRSQINELSRTASQNAQTATILANNEAQTAMLEQYLAPIPRPAYIVQNPNCCSSGTCSCNTGCGSF